jgi:hypothetical protein
MICENCKKHIDRKFFSKGKSVNCLNYVCERPFINKGYIECTRDEICDYIYQIIQPERSKREDSTLCIKGPGVIRDEVITNDGPIIFEC